MGRDAEAEKLLQRVVDANPKDANSLQLAGELLLNSDPNRALELLQRAEGLQPSAHNDLLIAHAYEHLSQPDEAVRYLNRAKARAPKDPEVLRAVAGEYRDQGKYDEAIAALQAIPSKTIDVQADLAYTYQLAGKSQEAAALYTRLEMCIRDRSQRKYVTGIICAGTLEICIFGHATFQVLASLIR